MRLIRLLVSVSPPALLGAILAGIGGGAALTATIALVNIVLNGAMWQQLNSPALAAAACAIIAAVAGLTFLSANTVSMLMQRSLAELRNTLCSRVLESRLVQVEQLGQSALVSLFTDDLSRVAQGAFALPVLVVNLSVCMAAALYLGYVHPLLCAVVLATQLATLGITALCFRRFNVAARAAMVQRAALVDNYHLLTDAIKEFKQSAARRMAFRRELFEPNVVGAMVASQQVNRLGNAMDAIAKAGFLATIAALFVLAAAVPGLASEADMRSVVMGFIFMATPLAAAINGTPQLLEANAALQRIVAFDLAADSAPARLSGVRHRVDSVSLVEASFAYRDAAGQRAFHCGPLNLSLRRGEILALSGGNGSGKTTAAKCLAGLYGLDAGVLAIDGKPVAPDALATCRELFTVIWSDNTLSRYHLPAGAEQRGAAAWQLLGLDACAPFACGWFDCSAMSTGQRRRVALAAALMDPRPFFILDEWSANQDKQFRTLFYATLLPQLRAAGHGILVITHDAAGVPAADRRIHMDDGLITGSHAERPPQPLAAAH